MSVKFDANLVSRVQQANDIVDVVSEHLRLDKKGKEFVGLCPFHQDHKPSLYVSPVKQIFKCFACGAGGDVFKFVQLRENVPFPEAVQRLGERAGIDVSIAERPANEQGSQADPKQIARANEWAMKLWQANLADKDKGGFAREYLERRRISVPSVRQWDLGLAVEAWDGLRAAARQRKIPEAILLQAGLIVGGAEGRTYDKFRNRLMFPIRDVTGRIIGFGGRTLADDPAKYLNSPATVLFDKSNCLYGLHHARHEIVSSGVAIVVEGYTDVIMAHQFGCRNVVATLGTSLTEGHARLLRRYAKRIVLVFDSDIAGQEAANRALDVCLAQKIDIGLAFVTEGKDPCDFLLTAGPEAFGSMVDHAVDVLEFKWRRLVDRIEACDNLQDRKTLVEEYLRSIALMERMQGRDPIADGLIRARLREITGLSDAQIRDQMRRYARAGRNDSVAIRNQRVVRYDLGRGYYAAAQAEVLEVLLNSPGLFAYIPAGFAAEDFTVPILQTIVRPMFEMLRNGQELTEQALLRQIEEVDAASLVLALRDEGRRKGHYQERLKNALKTVEQYIREKQREKMLEGLDGDNDAELRRIQELRPPQKQRHPGMRAR
ncbi:MAG: DNA primase [Sedimentisphaerales bacterium]|nr:DNA primase [Sedimentisphaerales bacterium]